MEEGPPIFTLVKQREIGVGPNDEVSLNLDGTLQMLCSFYTSEDLGVFLASEGFERYARCEDAWVVLELGIYKDHTKTVELIPSKEGFVIADSSQTGVFTEGVWKGTAASEVVEAVNRWHSVVCP